MKKILYYLPFLFILSLASCSEKEDLSSLDGEGILRLNVSMEEQIKVSTRTLTDEGKEELESTCKVRIFDKDATLIRKYQGISNIPAEGLKLVSGDYSVQVTAGNSVAASFKDKFYEGKETFTITKGNATPVTVVCQLKNTLVRIKIGDTAKEIFQTYKIGVGIAENGMLEFTPENADDTGYFIFPADDNSLKWIFNGTPMNGGKESEEITNSGEVPDMEAATLYTLTFDLATDAGEQGGGILKLDVDTEPLYEEDSEIIIYQRPSITGMTALNERFDVSVPTYLEPGSEVEALSLWISTSNPLASALMSCQNFSDWGLPVGSMDFVTMSDSEKTQLEGKGISVTNRYDMATGCGNMGIYFSAELMTKIAAKEGSYTINLTATDSKGNRKSVAWNIAVTKATVIIAPSDTEKTDIDTWATQTTLRASISQEPATDNLNFRYRTATTTRAANDWTIVPAIRNGNELTATVTGLSAGTRYEYQVMDGDAVSESKYFTTETKAQPENAGFENWTEGSGKTATLIYGSGQAMWWDSGNHGSATMSKNVTIPDTQYKHSGTYSAKLASQFVGIGSIGKFAAGNLFAGKYLETTGTDGVIGWGRPFTSRPKALHGYIRYEAATVTYDSDKIAEGDTDQGQIFIALGDWKNNDSAYPEWPFVVRTKESQQQLFDHTQANTGTIAYGQQTWTESTGGDGMVEFNIPLEYWVTDRRPQYIILVGSASKYGDYFSGGPSTMWIDDLELIYE